jgi:hypothetical protein
MYFHNLFNCVTGGHFTSFRQECIIWWIYMYCNKHTEWKWAQIVHGTSRYINLCLYFIDVIIKVFGNLYFTVVAFFWYFWIIDISTLCLKLSMLKPVLEDVRDVALFHYPSCTDSIKPILQVSCNFVVINATKGLHFIQIFR